MSLPTQYQEFIALSRYARWLPDEERRESWDETVDRVVEYHFKRFPIELSPVKKEIRNAIYNLEVMPSMRTLMTAGEALDRDNVAAFNCSYREVSGSGEEIHVLTPEMEEHGFTTPITINVSTPISFDEIMYILMCGTGVGFSCERQAIASLPTIGHKLPRKIYYRTDENYPGVDKDDLSTYSAKHNKIYVADTKYGWASALRILIVELYNGNTDIKWDITKVRAAGQPLLTFGGRASGPEPLVSLFKFTVDIFKKAKGRKLTSVECHDITCKIAEVVVVGGVRRSALISLSNLTDQRMAVAKSGEWWKDNVQRALANNSICFTEKPDVAAFMREWNTIYESKSGERGIFNRVASQRQAERNGRRDSSYSFGTNPCSEIILRDRQFCNLSEVVVRNGDTYGELERKVRIATILGTLQATLTDFKYLSKKWKENTEEEALLGVSLTGIMDHPVMAGQKGLDTLEIWLDDLKDVAIETNKEWAEKLGINQSAAITCVKPSGTVSQLVDSASGIHARYAPYYIRTVRADKKDPLAQFMVDKGFPVEDDITKPDSTYVFSFPVKSPQECVLRDTNSALEQLSHWLVYQRYWCEHKPSITVYVKEEEWPEVGAWVWKHFDEVSGVSFLPHTDHIYEQAPYQEITEDEYRELESRMPRGVDWSLLGEYERYDTTTGSQELSCTGGACELVDIGNSQSD